MLFFLQEEYTIYERSDGKADICFSVNSKLCLMVNRVQHTTLRNSVSNWFIGEEIHFQLFFKIVEAKLQTWKTIC